MIIRCPSCNGEISASNVDITSGMAKCTDCNNVFNFSNQIPVNNYNQALKLRNIIAPKTCFVERGMDGLTLVRSWFSLQTIGLTFFCIFWNGFLAVWFTIAITQKIYIMAFFGSLHAAVGLGMLYVVLAGYFNKTFIAIKQNSFEITHRPFPWFGQRTLNRADLKQFYSKEDIHYSDRGCSRTYSLYVITQDGKNLKLLEGLPTSDQALFMEQEIEKYLRIEDVAVNGELPRA